MPRLFNEISIEALFKDVLNNVDGQIRYLSESNISSIPIDTLADKISQDHSLKGISIDWTSLKPAIEMRSVHGRSFPGDYDVDRNKSYLCAYVN